MCNSIVNLGKKGLAPTPIRLKKMGLLVGFVYSLRFLWGGFNGIGRQFATIIIHKHHHHHFVIHKI